MLNEVAAARPVVRRARVRGALTFLPSIQALRAVAVSLVVVFHLWPSRLTGGYVGVDVFFVISGFLITDHLLRSAERGGGIRLGPFYARRVRRLLPAALLVLLVTAVATVVVVPRSLWEQFLTGVAASAVYAGNWLFAARSVDYFAADNADSPVQHYWSLGVEEQFYLVWPLLLLVLLAVAARVGVAGRRVVLAGLVLLGSVSFVVSVWWTAADQVVAYYATPTHVWEFVAGGLVAVLGLGARRAARPVLAGVAMVAGVGLVVGSAVVLDGATAFPGWVAVVPVVGAVLVIAFGYPQGSVVARVVELAPVQLVGRISYALYLWHWPVVVLAPYVLGRPLWWAEKLVVLAGLVPLAWATTRWVEDPVRRWSPRGWRSGRVVLAGVGASAVLAGAVLAPVAITNAQVERHGSSLAGVVDRAVAGDEPCFGAAAALPGASCPGSHTVRDDYGPVEAAADTQEDFLGTRAERDDRFRRTCAVVPGLVVERCDVGRDTGGGVVVVVGDSHANHLMAPVVSLAADRGMAVVEVFLTSCRPVLPQFDSPVAREHEEPCTTWKSQVFDYVAGLDASVVITSGAAQGYRGLGEEVDAQVVSAYRATWQQWLDAGHRLLVVSDVPLWDVSVPECVEASGPSDDPCTRPRDQLVGPDLAMVAAQGVQDPRLEALDLYDAFCDPDTCHSVVGGVVTHKDTNHMTPTFAATLAPRISAAMADLGAF
ncbi:acyltransferase family protein [Cellulomonas sp. P4]|uniref:acyltransferase family protein n=1 Tax=Cellulomonas sp. P4 TaxID=3142533 RepID=UPI0031BA9A7C